MVRNFNLQKRSSANLLGRWAFLLLMLALIAGSTTPGTAAQQKREERSLYLSVIRPEFFCLGEAKTIRVTPTLEDKEISPGSNRTIFKNGITGIQIKAEILPSKDIATVEPASQWSGSTMLVSSLPDLGLSEATFTVRARKVGTTFLILTAQVPAQYAGGKTSYFGPRGAPPSIEIRVVNCKYRVTAFTTANAHYPNLYSYLMSKAVGVMETKDGALFSGTATADWRAFSFSVRCSHTHTFQPAQAQLRGTFSQNGQQLRVQVIYDPAAFSSQNCASSNSGELLAPSITADVPSSGGSSHHAYSYDWGAMAMAGSYSIYVTPIKSK